MCVRGESVCNANNNKLSAQNDNLCVDVCLCIVKVCIYQQSVMFYDAGWKSCPLNRRDLSAANILSVHFTFSVSKFWNAPKPADQTGRINHFCCFVHVAWAIPHSTHVSNTLLENGSVEMPASPFTSAEGQTHIKV